MKIKKYMVIILVILILFAIYILIAAHLKKLSLNNIFEQIEKEDINDLSLTIYHMHPYAVLFIPISGVEDFVQRTSDEKIVISGRDLGECINLFKKINGGDLKPRKGKPSYLGLRMCYVLESKKNGKLLDVAMWGEENSMFINDMEVEENSILYDVIIPFLPTDEASALKEFKTHKNRISY